MFNYGIFSNFTKSLNHENLELYGIRYAASLVLVSSPDPTLEEEKGLVNLGRILGPALRNFHAPMRS